MKIYQHSGKYGFAPALFLAVGIPLLFILSVLYSYITLYNPIAGYLTLLILAGYVFISGAGISFLLKYGKSRNKTFVIAASVIGGLLALYFAWVIFLYALTNRLGGGGANFLGLLLDPFAVWNAMVLINKTGWYKIFGTTPSGVVLWIMWGIEAVVIVLGIAFIGSLAIDDEMFCEQCDTWCEVSETKHLKVPPEHIPTKASGINVLTLNSLETAESTTTRPVITAELLKCQTCPTCKGWRYKFVDSEIDDDGNEKDKAVTIPGIVAA